MQGRTSGFDLIVFVNEPKLGLIIILFVGAHRTIGKVEVGFVVVRYPIQDRIVISPALSTSI